MTACDMERIRRKGKSKEIIHRIVGGCIELLHRPWMLLLMLLYGGLCQYFWHNRAMVFRYGSDAVFGRLADDLAKFSICAFGVMGFLLILYAFGNPVGSKRIQDCLQKVGISNRAGESPVLLSKRKDRERPWVTVFRFDSAGIPLEEWESSRTKIEAALDITIGEMRYTKGKKEIALYTVEAESDFPELINWDDSFMPQKDSELVLGQGMFGLVTVDLSSVPHILIGGSTGSGKSILLKCLLMQALKKDFIISIADFKGGVDYPPVWHEKCTMCFDEETLLHRLSSLAEELECRKKLLKREECANIDEYNRRHSDSLQRQIFACDELAEMLDKTGMSKEQKETVSLIENKLATIARQGRAFGIHLFLATQRPDANILGGQIKNNLDCRICGRADNVLSQIILDSTAAADTIPKYVHGRFMLYDGTVFQGFLFDENSL